MSVQKTKVAILDLTGCTGCEVNLLRLGAALLDYAQDFEITNWRMIQEEEVKDYDVVLVDGYACNEEQVELLRQARETCGVVVALGACAISGNVFSQLTPENYERLKALVYSPEHQAITKFVKPVPKVVEVDHLIHGCPASVEASKKLLDKLRRHPVTSKVMEVRHPDYMAKIEGHGSLRVDFARSTASFSPEEGERFVEGLVLGKPYLNAPRVHSRICGICPVAHTLCATRAIEKALGIRPVSLGRRLRRIFACGQMVQSHLLHLYFMVLPSLSGLKSSLEMSMRYPAEFHLCLNIKRIAEEIFDLIGGAHLHPVSITVGGFTKVPPVEKLMGLRGKIQDVLDEAEDLVTLFSDLDWPDAVTASHMLCIRPDYGKAYPMWGQEIRVNGPEPLNIDDYKTFIRETIVVDKPSKVGRLVPDRPIKTGALARLSRYWERLHPLAKEALEGSGLKFGNPFHNSLAQAVEILHFLEEAIRLLDTLQDENLREALVDPMAIRRQVLGRGGPWPRRGVSVIEAPRGLLIHEAHVDNQGNISYYNIVPPTALNLSGLAEEASLLLERYREEPAEKKRGLLEDLVRSIDPCITCSVH